MTELAHRLSSEIMHMPTCAVAKFTFTAKSWSSIGRTRLAKVALDSKEIQMNRYPRDERQAKRECEMAKTQAPKTTATHDRRLRSLESELEKVTKRFRVAKLKARAAKAEAKAVKKEMKHARSALIAAQDEHEPNSMRATEKKLSDASSGRAGPKAKTVTNAAPKRRIADSPERVRQLPRKRRSASVAVSTPAPPPPDLATPPSELLEPDAHREPHPTDSDTPTLAASD